VLIDVIVALLVCQLYKDELYSLCRFLSRTRTMAYFFCLFDLSVDKVGYVVTKQSTASRLKTHLFHKSFPPHPGYFWTASPILS